MITLRPPELEFVARGHVDVDPSVSLGHREDGHRMFSNIFGGLIEGPFLEEKSKMAVVLG
jgi:hypothetical protein